MAANLAKVRDSLQNTRQTLLKKRNVVGVGIGYKMVEGKETGELSVICSVKEKVAKAQLAAEDLIPQMLDDIPTDVFESGEIVAQQDPTGKFRPAPGGVSVGHIGVTAGTLGMWVKKNGKDHILSNNHVLANSNKGNIGDTILQPGAHDSGTEKIAELAEFIQIKFGGEDNLVDCAIARAVETENGDSGCNIAGSIASLLNRGASGMGRKTRLKALKVQAIEDIVKDEILNIGKVSRVTEAALGLEVKKMGRTTGLTTGKITQLDATINVSFGVQSAFFTDQVITTDMSQGGDSGSVLVTKADNQLVGLLFAGSDTLTVFNRIQNVISALGITI
jgi:hypothetical protein